MTQTDPSPQKPNRVETALKGDKDHLNAILLQLTTANPREIEDQGLDVLIDQLTRVNQEIQDLRREEPAYFTTIKEREKAADTLQEEIRSAVDYLSTAADALGELGGSLKDKRELFYPKISGSIRSLRNALKQFQMLSMENLSQTSSPPQQPGGPEGLGLETLKEDKAKLDKILKELGGPPRRIKESSKLNTHITDLLAISSNADMFRNFVPRYFTSIDALQQNIRDAVDNLAMAADVLDEKNLHDKSEVFYPKISASIPLLDSALSQFQLPDDLLEKEEHAS